MKTLLAVDASMGGCSVALTQSGKVQEHYLADVSSSSALLPMINELLQQNQLKLSALEGIAYAAGPGSFTGLRVVAGVVQGLAYAAGKPVIPVSSLQVMACEAIKNRVSEDGEVLWVAMDARMGDVYLAGFRVNGLQPDYIYEDCLLPCTALPDVLDSISGKPVGFVGEAWQLADLASIATCYNAVQPRARSVASLAVQCSSSHAAEQALPVYLREQVSWKKWQKKAT